MSIPTAGDPPEPDRHRVALHESGHAVLAHLLGIGVLRAALYPDGWLAGGFEYRGYALVWHPSFQPRQCENVACMALGGEAVEVLEYGSADPEGLFQDHPTVANALKQHPGGMALWPVLRARAEQLLSAPDSMAAVHALAAALEQAGARDDAAIQAHVRHLPRCHWALPD